MEPWAVTPGETAAAAVVVTGTVAFLFGVTIVFTTTTATVVVLPLLPRVVGRFEPLGVTLEEDFLEAREARLLGDIVRALLTPAAPAAAAAGTAAVEIEALVVVPFLTEEVPLPPRFDSFRLRLRLLRFPRRLVAEVCCRLVLLFFF